MRYQKDFLVPGIKVFKLEQGLDKVANYFKDKHGIELDIKEKLSSGNTPIGYSHHLPISENLKYKVAKF